MHFVLFYFISTCDIVSHEWILWYKIGWDPPVPMLTLSLYSTLMLLQHRMEGSASWGIVMTRVKFPFDEEAMGSPTSFKRSLVWTLLFPRAKKLCFEYTVYLGLISRDELFSMQATTFIPSPAKADHKCQASRGTRPITRSITLTALTLEETRFIQFHIHWNWSWAEDLQLLILGVMLWRLQERNVTHSSVTTRQQRILPPLYCSREGLRDATEANAL